MQASKCYCFRTPTFCLWCCDLNLRVLPILFGFYLWFLLGLLIAQGRQTDFLELRSKRNFTWRFLPQFEKVNGAPFLPQYLVYQPGIHTTVRSIDMNALAWVGVPARLTLTAKSANVGRANSGRRLGSKLSHRRAVTQSLYTRTTSRAIFGFSFAPKQKESAPTDGLSSYGMDKLRPHSEDNSDNFSKNPMFLKKTDAKDEYGFNREMTNVGTRASTLCLL